MVQGHKDEIMPFDIQSPLIGIRMKRGLSPSEMAIVLGVSVNVVADMENGVVALSENVQKALSELGLDGPAVADKQLEFIQKKHDWLVQRFARTGEGRK